MRMHDVIYCVMVFALTLTSGCATYAHRVVNTGGTSLYCVTVRAEGRNFDHGYLVPGATKGYMGSMRIRRSPPPVVCWRTAEHGETLSEEVSLSGNPWGCEVVFKLDGKHVTATLEPK